MAIEGLKAPEVRNMADEVGASVDALDMLGLVEDREQVTESVKADFASLEDSGVAGEKFVQLPRGVIELPEIIKILDGASYPDGRTYPETYVYDRLWTPGTDPNGYGAFDVGNLAADRKDEDWQPHARVAVHNPDSPDEPLLHFLNMPFDNEYAKKRQETQLDAIDKAAQEYGTAHEGFEMTPLNAVGVAMIALSRRIKGEKTPMSWGFMRDATLSRKTVDGGSYVGDVDSLDGGLRFVRSDGRADSGVGVGLSVGPKVLSPQTS
jgi:hypothetical protein